MITSICFSAADAFSIEDYAHNGSSAEAYLKLTMLHNTLNISAFEKHQ